jgi:predicted permease
MWQDFQLGLRLLWKHRTVMAIAILSLSLGIGANISIFSLTNAVLLRPLPGVPQPGRMIVLTAGRSRDGIFSYPDYVDLASHRRTVELAAMTPDMVSLGRGASTEFVVSEYVSPNYFLVMGVSLAAGTGFVEPETRPVVILGHSLVERLGRGHNLVGQPVQINGYSYEVVGISPPEFHGSSLVSRTEVWIPVTVMQGNARFVRNLSNREVQAFQVIGRLRPRSTIAAAQTETSRVDDELARSFPRLGETKLRVRLRMEALAGIPLFGVRRQIQAVAALLAIVVGLVLVVACANVSNLLLARAVVRRREIAIRLAVGATAARLTRQLLAESFLLALLGTFGGFLISVWTARLIPTFLPRLPGGLNVGLDLHTDWRVFTYTIVLAFVTVLLFGLVPAIRSTRTDLAVSLSSRSVFTPAPAGGTWRLPALRELLVIFQIVFSSVLVIVTGLFILSLRNAEYMDLGFRAAGLLVLRANPDPQGFPASEVPVFFRRAAERISATPGVQSVSSIGYLPLSFINPSWCLEPPQSNLLQPARPRVNYAVIGTGYFSTTRISLLKGREFSDRDSMTSPAAVIINETLAEQFWRGKNPIGATLKVGPDCSRVVEIIGVAGNSKYGSLGESPRPFLYVPFAQQPELWQWRYLLVRASAAPESILPALTRELRQMQPGIGIQSAQTMVEHVNLSLWPARAGAWLFGLFSLLAVCLASAGIYGVVNHAVVERIQEIGIRMALGATRADVLLMILRRSLALAVAGTLVGSLVALVSTRLIARFLYGVKPAAPVLYIALSLFLVVIAVVAAFFPAHRASSVDPISSLRQE